MTNKTSGKLNSILKKVAIVIPMLYVCIMYISNCMYYSESDDGMMNGIAVGSITGKPDEHLIYINSAYGYLTKALYKISNSINWYAITYLALIVLCTYTMWFIFSKYINYWVGFCIAIFLESFCIYFFTFTNIAFLSSLAALILLIDFVVTGVKYSTVKKVLIGVAIVILCISSFIIRRESFVVTVFILVPLLLLNFKNIIKSKKIILMAGLILAGIITLNFSNKASYNTDMWKDYTNYNSARYSVIDYPISSYEENTKFYKEKGLSKNDLECFRNWIFGDKEVYPEQTLKEIVKNTPFKTRYNLNPLKYKIESIYNFDKYLCYLSLIVFLILTVSAMLKVKKKRKYYLSQIIVLFIYLAYIFVVGRSLARVMTPAILISTIVVVYSVVSSEESKKLFENVFNRKIICSISIIILCGLFMTFNYMIIKRGTRASNVEFENLQTQKYIKAHSDNLFLIGFRWLVLNNPVNKISNKETFPNLIQTGDQDIYSNTYYYQMKKMNVSDKYKNRLLMNLLYRKNTFMLGNKYQDDLKVQKVRLFLEEHSKRRIECKVVEKIKGTNTYVYQFK